MYVGFEMFVLVVSTVNVVKLNAKSKLFETIDQICLSKDARKMDGVIRSNSGHDNPVPLRLT